MKILSAEWEMHEGFSQEQFCAIIVSWLKNVSYYRTMGELFNACENKNAICLQEQYCVLDTFESTKDNKDYFFVRLRNQFYGQIWETEAILESGFDKIKVYLHLSCSGDIMSFDQIPETRSEVVRYFVRSGYIKQRAVPVWDKPIYASPKFKDWLISAINGSYAEDLPLVFVTMISDSMGYYADVEKLARLLAGIAYVVVEPSSDFSLELKDCTCAKNPYNGYVGIYFSSGIPSKTLRVQDGTPWGEIDRNIMNEVIKFVTARIDFSAPNWKAFRTEKLESAIKKNEEMLEEFFFDNDTLTDRLKAAEQRIGVLVQESFALRVQNERLKKALEKNDSGLLKKSPIKEFFDGEQNDLIVSILSKALQTYHEPSRAHELLDSLLEENQQQKNGLDMFEKLKRILSNGDALKEKDFAELRELGFELVNDKNHYKLVYRENEKYWFTLFKTPSDFRGGKNIVSDISKSLSVYR